MENLNSLLSPGSSQAGLTYGLSNADSEFYLGLDFFSFKCYWIKLACLDAFLDSQQVWAFEFFKTGISTSVPNEKNIARTISVLTRMSDFADIWGPIYTVPAASGLIKHYVVSKGAICRVGNNRACAISGAG